MSAPLRWKLLGGFLLVFIAGAVLGVYVGAQQARRHRLQASSHPVLVEKVQRRMQARLDLTPEQLQRTAPVFDATARKLEEIRTDTGKRVREAFTEGDRALAPQLTSEQRAKMETLEAEHQPNSEKP
jgi:uncharacterized membrane-anchored protein YhcB (DUF1043 family)